MNPINEIRNLQRVRKKRKKETPVIAHARTIQFS